MAGTARAPSYIADAIRAGLPTFGIVEQGKVTPMRHRKAISQRAEP